MKKDTVILLLAILMVGWLIFVTWADVALSAWIVGHSGVEDMMIKEGKQTESLLKDAFFHFSSIVYVGEIGAGGALIWLLWRKLPRQSS